jgi:hypothetical protein
LGALIALFALCPAASASASDSGGDSDAPLLAREDAAAIKTVVVYEIESAEMPLAALPSRETWAFANLIIALICLIVSVATLVTLPAAERKRARDEISGEYDDYRACIERDRLIFKLLGAGVGAASVVLFLLTENPGGAMQPANGYTWLMALVLLAQLSIIFMAFKGGKCLCGLDDLTSL